MKKFYVYAHIVEKEIVYIGCGTGSRSYNLNARSRRWKDNVNKDELTIKILKRFSVRDDAEAYELELLKKHNPIGNTHDVFHSNGLFEPGENDMTITDQFIRGLKVAAWITDIPKGVACKAAGVNEATLYRFLNRETDIKMVTLSAICNEGYGMSLSKVIALGE